MRVVARYGLAALTSLAALSLMLALTPYMDAAPFSLFFAAVFLTAWYGGAGPGLLAAVLTAALSNYFVMPPAFQLKLHAYALVPLGVYVAVSALVAVLLARFRRTALNLREQELKFRAVFEKSLDAIGVSRHGVHLMANPAYVQLFGCAGPEELVGRSVLQVIAPDQQPLIRDRIQRRARGEPVPARYETRGRRKDGTEFDLEVDVSTFEMDGEQNTLVIARDFTARKQAEQEVKSLNVELERQVARRTAQLEAANKELEAFSYSVSHDLRAPVRAIAGFANMLREDHAGALGVEARHLVELIGSNAARMDELIRDLLAFSRLTRQELHKAKVDMTALARSVLDELLPLTGGRQVHVTLHELLPARGDGNLLRQVFANLISNALKFTRRHPAPAVEIGSRRDGPELLYFVRDNGVGFDMAYAHKLFKVFQRLHSLEEFEGTGVGLAIVHRIVQRHGGRLWATSQVNEGACFCFTLPVDATTK